VSIVVNSFFLGSTSSSYSSSNRMQYNMLSWERIDGGGCSRTINQSFSNSTTNTATEEEGEFV
jgi:hypothetical protein